MEISWRRSLKIAFAIMFTVLVFQLLFIKAEQVDWLAIPFSGLLYLAIIYIVNQIKKASRGASSNIE
ncbi:hypothetical protein N7931_02040 [Catenovulum sp. 2E275]|uniref:hypothetical protein n=1 Tax=Catenovulum sp. 2E275 TaxID=2980497 RepID=UPI0021D12AA0|nr:hypothetical protein [Catenovulum sp. 2E275]MCU4674400.1 hypothetical protein [Catenovulum sp. 2E275]